MSGFATAPCLLGLLSVLGVAACSAARDGSPSSDSASPGGNAHAAGSSANGGAAGLASGGALSGGQPSAGQTTGGGGAAQAGGGGQPLGGGGPCDGATILCSDFEADAIPAELVFWPEHLRATQGSFVAIDEAIAHGGKRALKVTGSDFSQMLAVAVPSKFWGRVYLRSDSDIQQGHNTYVAAGTGTGDPNNGTYIRIGEHQCQLELNRSTDDKELLSNGGTYMCQGGVRLVKDTWYCLEFYFDGPGQETRVFVDGAEVSALHSTDWGTYEYKVFKLGFEKYHGDSKTLWYDDLALGPAQLHCL